MRLIYFLIYIFCLVSCSGCGTNKVVQTKEESATTRPVIEKETEKEDIVKFPVNENSKYVLTSDFDLGGKVYSIPSGVTIKQKRGVIKNGTLIGNGTKIDAKSALFENVRIKGDWNVPKISTDLFVDLSYDNALRDVVALTSSKVHNVVRIKKGNYVFAFCKNSESGIVPASNTKLQIDGTLLLKPNDFKNYYIVNIKGDNIHVFGNGTIEGDKFTHTGKDGEWGMGVNFANATNCSLSDLSIKNCWGDCVYIGKHSKNCSVSNCILDNGRRQGISITSGENIKISDCKISNVNGTAPEFAIDLEPNKGDTVKNVTIKNVSVDSCVGGFLIYTGKNNSSYVEGVELSKCKINSVGKKEQLKFIRCHDIKVSDCKALDGHLKHSVVMSDADNAVFTGNTFHASQYVLNTISGVTFKKNTVYGGVIYPTDIKNMANRVFNDRIRGNKVIREKTSK